MTATTFLLTRIQRLRNQASKAARSNEEPPPGWSKSLVDPMDLLAVFKPLRMMSGFILRAYQFFENGNGNAFVWALPLDAPFPEPDDCPRLEDRFLAPPKPLAALDDLMEAIAGDGTPWSYLCASLFCREIHEFGARWHGCGWSTHTILGKNPLRARRTRRGNCMDEPSGGPDEWAWAESEPVEWKPCVLQDGKAIRVVLHTFSGLGSQAIFRHMDLYRRGRYCFKPQCKAIAAGPAGFVF